jgi:hypothetical protein
MAKTKPKNWALGRWSIDSISMWGKGYIDEESPATSSSGPTTWGRFSLATFRTT